jgi:hypothetical protein
MYTVNIPDKIMKNARCEGICPKAIGVEAEAGSGADMEDHSPPYSVFSGDDHFRQG